MKVWALLFAFVGIQMAWNLQPFVGESGEPFQLFRRNEGNFYTAVVYSMRKLTEGGDPRAASDGPATSDGVRGPSWYDSGAVHGK